MCVFLSHSLRCSPKPHKELCSCCFGYLTYRNCFFRQAALQELPSLLAAPPCPPGLPPSPHWKVNFLNGGLLKRREGVTCAANQARKPASACLAACSANLGLLVSEGCYACCRTAFPTSLDTYFFLSWLLSRCVNTGAAFLVLCWYVVSVAVLIGRHVAPPGTAL